jgi:putative transposase
LADRIAQYNQQFIQGDYCDIRTKVEACPLTCFVSKNGASFTKRLQIKGLLINGMLLKQ